MRYVQEITLDIFVKNSVIINAKQGDGGAGFVRVRLAANGTVFKAENTWKAYFRAKKADGHGIYNPAEIEEGGTVLFELTRQTLACPGMTPAEVNLQMDDASETTLTFYIDVEPAASGDEFASKDEFKLLTDAIGKAETAADSAKEAAGNASEAAKQAGNITDTAREAEEAREEAENRRAQSEAERVEAEAARVEAEQTRFATEEERKKDTAATKEAAIAAEAAKVAALAAEAMAKSWAVGETGTRDGEDTDNAKFYSAQALIALLQALEAAEAAQRVAQGALGYYETPETLQEHHPEAEAGNWAIVGTTDTIWVWDTEAPGWTDSGNKTDLSQYYTRTEIDDIIAGITAQSIGALPITGGTVTGSIYLNPPDGAGQFGIYREGKLVLNMSSSGDGGSYSTAMADGVTEATRVQAGPYGGMISLRGPTIDLTTVAWVDENGKIIVKADEVKGASRTWMVDIPASGWVAGEDTYGSISASWSNTVEAAGMVSGTDSIMVAFAGGDFGAAAKWRYLRTGDGTVTLWSQVKPDADFSLRLTEVR